MDEQPTVLPTPPRTLRPPEMASELNNLLQIIAGTSALIENIWEGTEGADKYFGMLRESIQRAALVTTDLVAMSGEVSGKILMHPEYNRLRHSRAGQNPIDPPRKRIMVVDDEKMLLILASELLRGEGYHVVTAQSGFECLDLFRASPHQFDLVLLDLSMPLMDGEETFQRLRALRPGVMVLLCTGFVQQERLNHMLEAGLIGFLQKPIGSQQYLNAVRSALVEQSISADHAAGGFAAAS